MHPEYFKVRFRADDADDAEWPEEFAIITAYATTGEVWTDEENSSADRELREYLSSLSSFVHRLTGYSLTTGHAEPGWAVSISFEDACDIGIEFKQDAIYFVKSGKLFVSYCDSRRQKRNVGDFLSHLDMESMS